MYPTVEFQDGDLRTKSSMVTRKCRDLTGSGRDERNTLCPVFGLVLGFAGCCEGWRESMGRPTSPLYRPGGVGVQGMIYSGCFTRKEVG